MIALDGKPLADALQYLELMEKATEERTAVVTVQRGKERIRVETRIVLPRREAGVTLACGGAVPAGGKGNSDREPHHHGNARHGAAGVGAGDAVVERIDRWRM